MESKFFELEEKGAATHIVLKHAPVNCLTPEFMEDICQALDEVKSKDESSRARALVLQSGIEGHFCSGMDPHYFTKAELDERKRLFYILADMLESFYKFGVPVISVVNGPALAGGAVLALLGDVVLMKSQESVISFSEVKVGVPVPKIIQDLIAFKAGISNIVSIALLGKNISPDAAQAKGIVDALYSNSKERDVIIDEYVERFARLPAAVVGATLWEMKEPLLEGKADFLHSFEDTFAPFLTDEYLGKGLAAIVDGKKPVW